jgi:glyoxylase-like metal-dependent hydrolase (beta-lactamase superfamily II)
MYFRTIEDLAESALTYLLADSAEQEAVVIDPLAGQSELIRALLDERDLRLGFVLRSHVHRPDPNACVELCRQTGARLVVGAQAPCRTAERRVGHGETLVFGGQVLRVLATPGHTPGCVSYLWRDRLFCGDAFDMGACRAGNRDADAGKLFDSLTQRIFLLPGETLLFPAHFLKGRTVTTIAEERRRHARLGGASREAFVTGMAGKARPRADAGTADDDELPDAGS